MPTRSPGYSWTPRLVLVGQPLGYKHMMRCLSPAWEITFKLKHDMTVWRVEGLIPFTCIALWRKIEEDELNSSSNSTTIGSLPWSSGALTPVDPGSLSSGSPARAPLSFPPIPNAVLEARDYMVSCIPATTGILDIQASYDTKYQTGGSSKDVWSVDEYDQCVGRRRDKTRGQENHVEEHLRTCGQCNRK